VRQRAEYISSDKHWIERLDKDQMRALLNVPDTVEY
jgi:hypothetical protein